MLRRGWKSQEFPVETSGWYQRGVALGTVVATTSALSRNRRSWSDHVTIFTAMFDRDHRHLIRPNRRFLGQRARLASWVSLYTNELGRKAPAAAVAGAMDFWATHALRFGQPEAYYWRPILLNSRFSATSSSVDNGRFRKRLTRRSSTWNTFENAFTVAFCRTAHGRRIGHPPVRGDRMSRPHGANFSRRVVTNGEDEIELGSARQFEFIPAFATQPNRGEMRSFQLLQGTGMDPATGMAAGAVSCEVRLAPMVQDSLGHDRAGRVPGT